jgi:hypothetical protein
MVAVSRGPTAPLLLTGNSSVGSAAGRLGEAPASPNPDGCAALPVAESRALGKQAQETDGPISPIRKNPHQVSAIRTKGRLISRHNPSRAIEASVCKYLGE